jgi:hypothetical protein
MFWDSEMGVYWAASKLTKADAGRYMDPDTGQNLSRNLCGSGLCADGCNSRSFAANNPWTAEPVCMKNGTVKFFNETKRLTAQYNPKELTIDKKVTVHGWNPETKEAIVGEEGGQRMGYSYYAKHRAQMNDVQSNPMYKDSGMSGANPLYKGRQLGRTKYDDLKTYQPGRPVYGNITLDPYQPGQPVFGNYSVRAYRPGRPVFGNITFEGAEHMRDVQNMRVKGRYPISVRQKMWLPANF